MINQAQLSAQLQRVQLLHQAGRIDEAWRAVSPLRAAIADHGQALRLFALVAQASGQVDSAADALRRIIAIEREPPEIVGALADLFGTAGRHDEALALWTRLTILLPAVADAHLNRAIAADSAGKHDLAIAAADSGLERFPGYPRLLATKAMALKNRGRIEESLAVFDAAVAADPDRALTRHNQAVALRVACRFDEACDAFAAAARLGMVGAQFHANWAAAALEAGRVDEAAALYEQAIGNDPGHRESLRALTRLRTEFLDGRQAFDHYRSATKAQDNRPEAWAEWINVLIAHERNTEAAEVAREALSVHPGHRQFEEIEKFTTGMVGDAATALEWFERAFAAQPTNLFARDSIALLALRGGRPERAAELLVAKVTEKPLDQVSWAQLGIAWRLIGDPREHWLCDYERLVMITEVPALDGGLAAEDYAAQVATALDPLHRARHSPGDQTLRGGTQTSGNLFARPEAEIQRFRDAILSATGKMMADLPDDPTHPFLSRKTSALRFSGSWSVRLSAGGHHVPHYHSEGWMSSAYYARLPPADADADSRHEGWIQFGVPPEAYALDLAPRRVVRPQPGRLVLFPSYLWHGTIPFAAGDRLTAAFDFQPLS